MLSIRLSNYFTPISHEQFQKLAAIFKKRAEVNFGTECRTVVHMISKGSGTRTCKMFLKDMTKGFWDQAEYTKLEIIPLDPTKKAQDFFAYAEFKGQLPRSASFTMHPAGRLSAKHLRKACPGMWRGMLDKQHTKTERSGGDHGIAQPAALQTIPFYPPFR